MKRIKNWRVKQKSSMKLHGVGSVVVISIAAAVFYATHALKLTKDITEDLTLCINKFI